MKNVKTTVWLDGKKDDAVTVDYSVTDLDDAARLLGFADHRDLIAECDEDELNISWDDDE